MLGPRESATRERICARRPVALRARPRGRRPGRAAGGRRRCRATSRCPCPPASTTSYRRREARHHVGDVWYQRTVRVPRGWDGERIVLRLDAATHRATVVGRRHAGRGARGRLHPVRGRRHRALHPGEEARVTVVVNNELSWTSIPPGFVQELEDGRRVQQYFHDFFNYAGLHRSVWLYATPHVHVSDVTVSTTEIDGTTGVDRLPDGRRGRRGARVRVVVRDAGGAEVAQADGGEARCASTACSCGAREPATCTRSTSRCSARRRGGRRLPAAVRRADGRRGRAPLPDQRRAVSLHRVRQARGLRGPRSRPRPRRHGPRFRAAGVARRELLPDVALPLRRGRPRLRRSARGRGHRRDGGRRAEPGHRHPDPRGGGGPGDLQRGDDQRAHTGDPPAGDPRAHRARQEPSVRGDLEHCQRARHRLARGAAVLRAAGGGDAPPRSDAARRLRELHAGHAGSVRDLRSVRRAAAQPLLRLVRADGRPRGRRAGAGGRAARVGGARQADHHDRVRRRHAAGAAQHHQRAVERGVPGGPPGHVPPRVRPGRRGRRRADLELRGLRDHARASCGSTATRRASSRAIAGRRRPRTRCAGAGGAAHERVRHGVAAGRAPRAPAGLGFSSSWATAPGTRRTTSRSP